jgi:hypothetical protein
MATTTQTYKVYPSAAGGISRASSGGAAWSNSNYTEIVPVNTIASTYYIHGITLIHTNNAVTADTSMGVEVDIATGAGGAEVVIITFPYVYRIDSAVAHYPVIYLTLPVPKQVAANTRLSVRVRQSLATTSVTYEQIKLMYSN